MLTKEPMPEAVDASEAVLDAVPVSVFIDSHRPPIARSAALVGTISTSGVYFSQQPKDLTVADSEVRCPLHGWPGGLMWPF